MEPLCVLDLDTVMPGLADHDFGDMVDGLRHRRRRRGRFNGSTSTATFSPASARATWRRDALS